MTVEALKAGDHIAFAWSYFGGGLDTKEKEVQVSKITSVHNGEFLVHFLHGHHSCAEYVKKEQVLAIGNEKGTDGIKGWSGKFILIQPEHPAIIENLKDGIKRTYIGIYSKLRIGICIPNRYEKDVVKMLINNQKYEKNKNSSRFNAGSSITSISPKRQRVYR
jgi:hypothetical protein